VADVLRTCANCGNMQVSGDFCEKCGTRMPAAPAPGTAAAYSSAQAPAPGPAAPPQSYAPRAPYGASTPPEPQYGYAAPASEQYRSGGQGLFGFQGSLKRSTLKMLWWVVLGLIGLYVLFNIILVAMAGNKFTIVEFFISLFFAGFLFVASWALFEGVGLALRLRDKADNR